MKIPFTLRHEGKLIRGFLSNPSGAGGGINDVPTIFHVMVHKQDGNYYWGALVWNTHKNDWWLPDSRLQEYEQYLGNIVELYYE